jgi:hypothetical protein
MSSAGPEGRELRVTWANLIWRSIRFTRRGQKRNSVLAVPSSGPAARRLVPNVALRALAAAPVRVSTMPLILT